MTLVQLESLDDPRIADYRIVAEPEIVRVRGLFVAEGRRVVERLIGERRFAIRSVLVSDAAHHALEPALAELHEDVPVYVCGARSFAAITGFDVHRGCLALAERPMPIDLARVLTAARTIVVLDGVANADNVGGVFRNAAAFGVDAVLLTPDCCDPLYRKAIRTSMAATLRVPFARMDGWPQGTAELRKAQFTLVALTSHHPSSSLDEFVTFVESAESNRPDRLALLVGAEGRGLSAGIEEAADHRVRIPIDPSVDSLNLAVATGIALARLSRGAAL
jgi:tRNA G18 (ribose-2'-O)-methylase SpoU